MDQKYGGYVTIKSFINYSNDKCAEECISNLFQDLTFGIKKIMDGYFRIYIKNVGHKINFIIAEKELNTLNTLITNIINNEKELKIEEGILPMEVK